MEIKKYTALPKEAAMLRTEVFVSEQGFCEEFDSEDAVSVHFVGFEEGEPVATCRYFYDIENGYYHLGRVAVKKGLRGRNLGSEIIAAAEESVGSEGGKGITVHSQLQASGFYEKCGYIKQGEVFTEENHPHIKMVKRLDVL